MDHEIEILDDADAVARRGAALVADLARRAVEDHGAFTFAVSGGHTPWAMFGELGSLGVPWAQTRIYQVDERVAPTGDPDRNLSHLHESLGDAPAEVLPMPVNDADLSQAAAQYGATLPDRFDLVHLGLGDDGHTASLVPGDPVLDVVDRPVALTAVYRGRQRMTLTYPALARADFVMWLVAGDAKVDPLARLRAGDRSIPAGRVEAKRSLILADRLAVGQQP